MLDPKQTFTNEIHVKVEHEDVTVFDTSRTLGMNFGESWVECGMNVPGAFHIKFTDNYQRYQKDLAEVFLLGATVEVYAIADGQGRNVPLLTGEITGIETDIDGRTTSTVIRGLDRAVKMMRSRRTTAYENRTAEEIIRELARLDGVMLGPDADLSLTRYENITQPNISDWQFATELAVRTGMFVNFDGAGRLRFRKVPEPTELAVNVKEFPDFPTVLRVGANVRRCRAGVNASDQALSVAVRGWDMKQDRKLTSLPIDITEMVEYRGRKISGTVLQLGELLASGSLRPYVETGTPYGSADEVAQAARALADDISSVFAELEILADGNPALVPGQTISLENAGPSYDGRYTITSARHEFEPGGHYVTWVAVAGRQVRSLYGLASGAGGGTTRISGVVNAIVDSINDPQHKGRVMVTYPWLDDTCKSRWARTLQFGGKGGGGQITPSVGDEVLVAFDRGDVNYPYVLGGLYGHESNLPSEHDTELITPEDHVNRLSLVSRAGHRVELLDADEGKRDPEPRRGVRLQNKDETLTVFLDQSATEITISSDGRISISGKKKVSITSDGDVSVNAASISAKARKISLEGDVSIKGMLEVTGPVSQSAGPVSFKPPVFSVASAGAASISGVEVVVSGGAVTVQGIPAPYKPLVDPI